MSDKKHMGSKLAQGVRQVQSERDQKPASSKITVAKDEAASTKNETTAAVKGAPGSGGNTQPAASRPAKKTEKNALHPKRVWPD